MRCRLILSLLAAACLPAAFPATVAAQSHGMPPARPGAAQPNNYRPTPETRDADCFLVAAVGSQSIMSNQQMSQEGRMMEPVLRGTASYFAGRLATRLHGPQLRAALSAASPVVESAMLRQLVTSCTTEFQSYMREVAGASTRTTAPE